MKQQFCYFSGLSQVPVPDLGGQWGTLEGSESEGMVRAGGPEQLWLVEESWEPCSCTPLMGKQNLLG